MRGYLLRYGELALKGGNRKIYEDKLKDNINSKIKDLTDKKVYHRYGRFWLDSENPEISKVLDKVPGLVSFSFGKKSKPTIQALKEEIEEIALNEDFESFKVDVQRVDKTFAKTSMEIAQEVGTHLQEITGKRVDLKNPGKIFYVVFAEDFAFVADSKTTGVGGLPVGTSGKVISLLSGGIDSPVSSYLMMKRGCEVVFFHGFNKTIKPEKIRDKIYKLAEKLSEYQVNTKLYLLPYGELQKELVEKVPEKRRMLLFRRSVKRLGNEIARLEGAKALVTGDSLSQVASQTIENISVSNDASQLPVFSPLLGLDKVEVSELAEKIGTYSISTLPYEDCCSLIASKHPVIKGRVESVKKYERMIDLEQIEKDILEDSILKRF